MKFVREILGFLLFLGAFNAQGMEPRLGDSVCSSSGANEARISWQMPSTPSESYSIERYKPESREWIAVDSDLRSYGTSKPVQTGGIYRVLSCYNESCSSSKVIWCPILPASADQIPERMTGKSGQSFRVRKSGELLSQTLQYNVYLFVQEFEGIDLSGMPPMSEPPETPESVSDWVHLNIYPNYTGYRDASLGHPPDPGPVDPDTWTVPHGEHSHDN